MPRKPRLHYSGAVYHVMLRGNGGGAIFFSDDDRRAFEALLADGQRRFAHRIHAYCWMANHVHLSIEVADAPLSRIMQALAGRYSRHVNRAQGRAGHLFQGRYRALLVDADSYLLELVRYIHLNPVRAGLVAAPACYAWSGHRAYLGRTKAPDWFCTARVCAMLARSPTAARRAYARFIADGMDQGRREEMHQGLNEGVLGSERFATTLPDAAPRESRSALGLHDAATRIAARAGMPLAQLRGPGRHRAAALLRHAIADLAVTQGFASLSEVARYFDRDLSTLSRGLARLRQRRQEDDALAATLAHYDDALIQIIQA